MVRGASETGLATVKVNIAGTSSMCSLFFLILLKKCFCLIIVHKFKVKFRIQIWYECFGIWIEKSESIAWRGATLKN